MSWKVDVVFRETSRKRMSMEARSKLQLHNQGGSLRNIFWARAHQDLGLIVTISNLCTRVIGC